MIRKLEFEKFHGCGNDFIIVDEMRGRRTPDRERSRLAKILTDRHFGIGADGIIFVEPATGADASMRLFEPAGNEADMCGNGMRCVGAYVMERQGKDSVRVLSKDGVKTVTRTREGYSVEMGMVRTTGRFLKKYYTGVVRDSEPMMRVRIRAGRLSMVGALVNSGEPHFVTKAAEIGSLNVRGIGDTVNADRRLFPLGVNLNFVQPVSPRSIRIRTYERGVYDETLACGTGATASAAVALMLGWVRGGPVTVVARGGAMRITLISGGTAVMSGPAVRVFEGSIHIPSGKGLRRP